MARAVLLLLLGGLGLARCWLVERRFRRVLDAVKPRGLGGYSGEGGGVEVRVKTACCVTHGAAHCKQQQHHRQAKQRRTTSSRQFVMRQTERRAWK